MNDPALSAQLRRVLLEAFPDYVAQKLQELGVAVPDEVAERAATVLDGLLMRLEDSPRDLGESPLELVRIATEPITEALLAAGAAPVERDAQAVQLHPDDVFDLYPATSRDLGEEVWRVHMQWGLERARLVAGMVPSPSPEAKASDSAEQSRADSSGLPDVPAVALFGFAEPGRTELVERIGGLGYRPLVWRNPAALEEQLAAAAPRLVLVDLGHPSAEDAVRRLAAAGIRIIGCGTAVTDFTQAAIMALGAEEVVELDRIVQRPDAVLPRLV